MSAWSNPNLSAIDRRLRAQVDAARLDPSPDLEGRILDAVHRPNPDALVARSMISASYLSAAGLLLLVGTVAISVCSTTPSPTPVVTAPSTEQLSPLEIVIGIDTTRYETLVRNRAGHLATAFESPLFDQARRIVADARHAVGSVLTRLPASPVRIETTRKKTRSPEGPRAIDSGV